MNLRNALIAAGFALLTVIAAMGWSRKSAGNTAASYAQPTYYDANGQAIYGSTASRGPITSESSPVPCVGNAGVAYQSAVYEPQGRYVSDRYGSGHPIRVIQRREPIEREYVDREPVSYDREAVRRGRSVKKSVAIVAGSAAGGALIGGLAGGGKGAGIGAASGGAAGFLYDRLTHNHR
jgi:hypothetical protein